MIVGMRAIFYTLLLLLVVVAIVVGHARMQRWEPPQGRRPVAATERAAVATLSSTPTPAPIVYRVTYYGPGFEGGLVACGTDIYGPFDSSDPTTAAAGSGGPPCGTRLTLCNGKLCLVVVIKDACGGCSPDHLDLSRAAWDALGQPTHVAATIAAPAPPSLPESGDLSALSLPDGVTTRYDGCSPTYACTVATNYYDAGSRTVALQPGEGWLKEVHELCHAHQHWAINGGVALDPSDYDLESWYASAEGVEYMAAVGVPEPWPFTHSAVNGIESFAWSCSWWYVQPGELASVCPVCYHWAEENLP
mgnify:CR=1 FL=1